MAVRLAGGGVRTVQHLAERGVRLVFEVWPSRCPRMLRSPEKAPGEAKIHRIVGTCLHLESPFAGRSQVVRI